MESYDWSERLIRQLVYKDHAPVEGMIGAAKDAGYRYGSIVCSACYQSWPCDILKDLRAWVTNGGYDDAPRACGDSHKCPRCGYMVGRPEREQK